MEKEFKMISSVPSVHIVKPILEFCEYIKGYDSTSFFVKLFYGFKKVDFSLVLRNICYNFYIGACKLGFQLS